MASPGSRHANRTLLVGCAVFMAFSMVAILWMRREAETMSSESSVAGIAPFDGVAFSSPSGRPIDSPHWWNRQTVPKGRFHTVFLIENWNRTNVKEISVPRGLTVAEFKKMASQTMNLPYNVTWYSDSKATHYLHNEVGSLDKIIEQSNRFVWTKPKELFRKVNGAYVYLWTSAQAQPKHDGNHDKTDMMKESVESLVRQFQKYGPYPVVMFHDLSEEVRAKVTQWFNGSTIIHWVSVAQDFPYQQLPDLPLLRERNLTGPGVKGVHSACSNRTWPTGYLQMIRFRVLGTWQQDILKYFDYIQQIDTDITIVKADFDPFVQTSDLDAILGFYHCEVDTGCANGLHEWILKYAMDNGLEWRWLSNVYPELVYSVNFATLNTRFFMNNPKIMKLFHDYVSTGYIETRRWTEQVLYPYILALFTDYDRVYVYGEHISLTHYRRNCPPRLACIRKPFFCCN